MSSDEVYGTNGAIDDDVFTESSTLQPTSPYSASKAAAEMIVRAYGCSFGIPYQIIRGSNCYGPKQFIEKLIPKSIFLLKSGRQIPIHGDGSNKRCFLYVGDMSSAIDTILCNGKDNEVYNISGDCEFTVKEIVSKLCDLFEEEDMYYHVKDRKFNDQRYHMTDTKVRELGWKPEMNIDQGLKTTFDWYCKVSSNYWGDSEAVQQAMEAHPSIRSHAN